MATKDIPAEEKELRQLQAFMSGRYICPACDKPAELIGLTPLKMAKCPSCKALNSIPKKINKFWLYYPLELGGEEGTLYKAYHESYPRRLFTVKILPRDKVDDEELSAKLKQEGEIIFALGQHQCILKGIEQGFEDDEQFVAAEFVRGERLDSRVRRLGKYSESEALLVVLRVLSAAAAIHNKGYFFRDVAPTNIMISDRDGAFLCSFRNCTPIGTSPALDDNATIADKQYMSPERLFAAPEDIRSLIFSLGLLLFYMLNAKTYFFDYEIEKVHQLATEESYFDKMRKQRLAHLDPALARILTQMIAIDIEQRYRSFFELEKDICQFLRLKAVLS